MYAEKHNQLIMAVSVKLKLRTGMISLLAPKLAQISENGYFQPAHQEAKMVITPTPKV